MSHRAGMTSRDCQPSFRTTADSIRQYIGRAIKASGIHGVHVGLNIRGQRAIFHDDHCYEIPGSNISSPAAFPIGCLAKPLVAIAALQLADRGLLRLEAPVTTYFPELAGYGKEITCTHLLTHTGGFQGTLSRHILVPGWSSADLIDFFRKASRLFVPGTVFNYDHLSLGLMCEVVSRVSGKTCIALVDDVISCLSGCSEPLSLRGATGFARISARDVYPDSQSDIGIAWERSICVNDLLSISRALGLNESTGTAAGLSLSHDAYKAIFTPLISIPRPLFGTSRDHLPNGFGLALATFCRGLVGYDGSLWNTAIGFRIHPQSEMSVVVGVQNGGQLYRRRLLSGVLACLELPPHAPNAVTQSEFDLRELKGAYIGNDDTVLNVVCNSGSIVVHVVQNGKVTLSIRGVANSDGSLTYSPNLMIDEPLFFRDSASGSPCLMIGLCAFKKAPKDA